MRDVDSPRFPFIVRRKRRSAISCGGSANASHLRFVVTILDAEWSGLPLAIVRSHSDDYLRVSNTVLPSISVGSGRSNVYEDVTKIHIEAEGQQQASQDFAFVGRKSASYLL